MKRRKFNPEFKRSIIEQLLSEAAGPVEICRRYNLSSGQLYTWKKQRGAIVSSPVFDDSSPVENWDLLSSPPLSAPPETLCPLLALQILGLRIPILNLL